MNQPSPTPTPARQLAPVDLIQSQLVTKDNVHFIAGKFHGNEARAREFLGNIVTAVRGAPDEVRLKLERCTPASFFAAARAAIDLDLKIDHNAHGYLVPYGDRAVFQVGWRGYLFRLRKHMPSLEIQVGIVMPGDDFAVKSEGGNASYTHTKADPFASDFKKAIGAYCYMSYEREGQRFSSVETVGIQEIMQMKNAAKTKNIWDAWFGEMMKKSVIRRAAKIAFAGIVSDIDEYDNQNSGDIDPDVVDTATSKTESIKNQLKAKAAQNQMKDAGGEVIDDPKTEPPVETPPEKKFAKCLNCDGKGSVEWNDAQTGETGTEPCASCDGSGKKEITT